MLNKVYLSNESDNNNEDSAADNFVRGGYAIACFFIGSYGVFWSGKRLYNSTTVQEKVSIVTATATLGGLGVYGSIQTAAAITASSALSPMVAAIGAGMVITGVSIGIGAELGHRLSNCLDSFWRRRDYAAPPEPEQASSRQLPRSP